MKSPASWVKASHQTKSGELFSKKLLTFFLKRIIIVDVSLKETNESHAPLAQLVEQ